MISAYADTVSTLGEKHTHSLSVGMIGSEYKAQLACDGRVYETYTCLSALDLLSFVFRFASDLTPNPVYSLKALYSDKSEQGDSLLQLVKLCARAKLEEKKALSFANEFLPKMRT